ncbi:MAG: lysophospholipid acyltransferase family protein [Pseudomonadota bacterium]
MPAMKLFGPIFRLSVLTLLGLVLVPLQWLSLKLELPTMRLIPMFFHRVGLPLLGVKVTGFGKVARQRPLLICSNHVSWLDIPAISSLTRVVFVSRGDVVNWPVLGLLAKLQRTIFVDRTKRTATRTASEEISQRLGSGDAVVLFPEGTTSDGNRVLTFRSSLLGAARAAMQGWPDENIHIQPAMIRYHGLHGLPIGRMNQPYAAWYGDMDFVPHLIDILKLGAIEVEVHFGDVLSFPAGTDRKVMAAEVEKAVRAMRYKSFSKMRGAVTKAA